MLSRFITVKTNHELQSGIYFFEKGHYKRAMRDLLPAAISGNPRAQYAVGYMYYYGYGVPQDTEMGTFWIEQAARHHHPKAIEALRLISIEREAPPPKRRTYKDYLK
jgi:TPR repeat protein